MQNKGKNKPIGAQPCQLLNHEIIMRTAHSVNDVDGKQDGVFNNWSQVSGTFVFITSSQKVQTCIAYGIRRGL